MVEEEDTQRQICRISGFGASAPDGTALVTFGTFYCVQEICVPREKTGKEGNPVEAFSRCTQELPPGSDHGLSPEIGLLHTL